MTTMIAARAAVKGIKMTVEEQMDFAEQMSNKIQEDIVTWFASELPDKRVFISDPDGEDVKEVSRQEMIDELCNVVALQAGATPIKEMHDA